MKHRSTSLDGLLWVGNQTDTAEAKPTLSSSEVNIECGPLVVAGRNTLRPRTRAVTAWRDRQFIYKTIGGLTRFDMEPKQYLLMEIIGPGPRFEDAFDSYLCLWNTRHKFLDPVLDEVKPGEAVNIKFTAMEMTDNEYDSYCEENGIELY